MKISKAIFHIKPIPSHPWWECKKEERKKKATFQKKEKEGRGFGKLPSFFFPHFLFVFLTVCFSSVLLRCVDFGPNLVVFWGFEWLRDLEAFNCTFIWSLREIRVSGDMGLGLKLNFFAFFFIATKIHSLSQECILKVINPRESSKGPYEITKVMRSRGTKSRYWKLQTRLSQSVNFLASGSIA